MSLFGFQSSYDTTPVSLHQLSPPLLSEYAQAEPVVTEWHDFASREADGNQNFVEIGLPSCKVSLFRVSRAEFALLMTYQGEVSVKVLNQTTNAYTIYNGILLRPEANSNTAKWAADVLQGWTDVVLTFYNLTAQ